ncbi:ATP-binding protein [Streptomyces sp. NPDC050509]|uniref:ATP-binding protein n=1 Tax=Streptomyces sp. NPDC050509 TaxID=3365620 RepID=UPI0037B87C61
MTTVTARPVPPLAPTVRQLPPVPPAPHGGEGYRLGLPNTVNAPKVARDFVTSVLGVGRHVPLVDDARLCVTEIVTNVHRHTRTPLIRVHMTVGAAQVTVSVADDDPWALPLPGRPGPGAGPGLGSGEDEEREDGQGLFLVARLSLAWGVTIHGGYSPTHKAIWFTLATDDAAHADHAVET